MDRRLVFWFLLVVAVIAWLCPMSDAQERSNTYYVAQFPGLDVGAKLAAAQSQCAVNSSLPCIVVIDSILAVWPQGTFPTRCSNCIWIDYRTPGRVATSGANSPIDATIFPAADVCAQIANACSALPTLGGIVDATGFAAQSIYNCSSTMTCGTLSQAVVLKLPPAILLSSASPGFVFPGAMTLLGMGTNNSVSRLQSNNASAGADTVQWTGSFGGAKDVAFVKGGSGSGAALHLIGSGSNSVAHNNFHNVRFSCASSSAGSIGLQMTAASASALVTENTVDPFNSSECETDFLADTSGTQGPTDNWIKNVTVLSTSGGGVAGFRFTGANTAVNHIGPGIVSGKALCLSVASGVSFTQFWGIRCEGNTANINNAGTGTVFRDISVDANTITDTGTCTVISGNGNVAFTQKMGCGGWAFPRCASAASPAVCASNSVGDVALAAAATTLQVNTTLVAASSIILVSENSGKGATLGVTCNTTTGRVYTVSAINAGTSFTITSSAAPVTNPACLSFSIFN